LRKFLKKNKFQIFKFAIVGIGSTLLNFLMYSLIFKLTTRILFASFIGYSTGLLNSFYLSNNWVFTKIRNKKINYALIIFVFIYVLGGLEMTIVINMVYAYVHNHNIAWITGAIVAAINNYLCSKYLLFND
tara:strand:- start:695 stop:1087 length:393 start_codon:yes stop_codon:yes gene_type:complete